jgi:RNA polymerase sigma-70 factor (ECF subfamily)
LPPKIPEKTCFNGLKIIHQPLYNRDSQIPIHRDWRPREERSGRAELLRMLEDYQLIWRLQRRDGQALREVYTKYKDAVYTTALALVNDPDAARDVVHDAFVAFAKDAPLFSLYGSLSSYLAERLINRTEEILRSSMYKVEEVPRTNGGQGESTGSADEISKQQHAAAMTEAMMQVPLPQRQAVALHLFCGLSFAQIAKLLRVNVTTAQSRYGYGLEKLSAVLDRQVEMSGSGNLEDKLRKIRLSTPPGSDEHILNEATAEFERASKLHVGRSRRTVTIATIIVAIVIALAAIVFLTSRGPVKPPQPPVTKRPEIKTPPAEPEKPQQQPKIQPRPKQPETKRAQKPEQRKPPVNNTEAKMKHISELAAAGDIDALTDILNTGDFASKMAAIKFLSDMPDERAQQALNDLAATLDPNNPQDYLLAKALGVEDFGVPEQETVPETQPGKAAEPNIPAAKKEQPAEKSLSGWLTDENGYTVAGTIQIGDVNIITDADGAFSIKGPNLVKIVSPFGCAVSDDERLGAIFHLDKKDQNDLEILCLPLASASGSIVDVNAQPVNDVKINIAPDVNEFRGRLEGPWQIDIKSDGSFEITSIPTGYPLVLIISSDDMTVRAPIGEPQPGEHLLLGEIVLEPIIEEDSIIPGR